MPSSSRGNIYALILVDHFTKWPEVLSLPDSKETTIAHAIYELWICGYGLMQRLHRDGAQNVNDCVIHELCFILGIGKSKSSHLHPQDDGLSEAVVKIVKSCVQKHVDTIRKDWNLHLQSSVYVICTSLTKSTGFSPAELIFGTSLKTPIELLATTDPKELQIPPQHHHQKQAQQFASALGSQLQQSFTNVQGQLFRCRQQMKQQYNKRTTQHHFKVGDSVMLWTPYKSMRVSHCCQPNWSGPWIVTKLIGPVNCKLQNSAGKETQTIHVNHLKPFHPRSLHLSQKANPVLTPQVKAGTSLPTCDIFDLLDHESDTLPEALPQTPLIARNWCQVDATNILPGRTHSHTIT